MAKKWGVDIGCPSCRHINKKEFVKCKAFPKIIPFTIIAGVFDHRKKFPNQKNDVVYEPIEKEG
jgi:hypothetical protein